MTTITVPTSHRRVDVVMSNLRKARYSAVRILRLWMITGTERESNLQIGSGGRVKFSNDIGNEDDLLCGQGKRGSNRFVARGFALRSGGCVVIAADEASEVSLWRC